MITRILSALLPTFSFFCTFILVTWLTSCQRHFGGFQASSRENFEHQIPATIKISEEVPAPEPIPLKIIEITEEKEIVALPVIEIPQPPKKHKLIFSKKIAEKQFRSDSGKDFIKEKPKKKKDKHKKRKPKFNDGLKTGTVFLLIAIIMGIFSLTQLTLLFGLVSILFLYFGLKKYYRQQRRKNIFK